MKLFLEVSALGPACGKMSFEPQEKTLLISWARHCPDTVRDFLIKTKCIEINDDDMNTYDELCTEIYKKHSIDVNNPEKFKSIETKILGEFSERQELVTSKQIEQVKTFVNNNIKKDCGKNNEKEVLRHKKEYKPGNSKMYYYSVGQHKIGGLHDAIDGDTLIEIKSRMKQANIRKNEYDLYQLFGYLLALNINQGKIVQSFDGKLFSSDSLNEKEFGIVNITIEPWKTKVEIMIEELNTYFTKLEYIINKLVVDDDFLRKAIPIKDRPIAISNNGNFKNNNSFYNKLLRHLE